MPTQPHLPTRPAKSRLRLFVTLSIGVGCVGAVAGLFALLSGDETGNYKTVAAVRGPLNIEVTEGGNVKARESQELKSEVRGYPGTKILSIVEEGITITAEDVANEKILVQLDTSDLVDKLTTAEIQFRGTQAKLTEARQAYEIQLNQSKSDIDTAELELKFARMDLKKYLGAEVSKEVLDEIKAFEEAKPNTDPLVPSNPMIDAEGSKQPKALLEEPGSANPAEKTDTTRPNTNTSDGTDAIEMSLTYIGGGMPQIDFHQYADPELLGDGEASQKLRKTIDDTLVAQKELGLAQTKLAGQKKLFDRGFVTENDYKNVQLDVVKMENSVKSTVAAQALFLNFDFPKESEKLMSDYLQAQRKLIRSERKAVSEMAKASANQLSAEATERLEHDKIKDLKEQVEKCTIRAKAPGLVLYGAADQGYIFYGQDQIKEGALVRERQTIITIPDITKMSVTVNVHEVEVKKIKVGQKVAVRIDAEADKVITGEVVKVGVLPDTENRWRNPDLKVYKTTIDIEGVHDWLKPGMSAQATITVERLTDVVYIPIQSVVPRGTERICYVLEGSTPVPRVVETGENTIEYIVITKGIAEGERVLLRPPAGSRQDDVDEEESNTGDTGTTDDDAGTTAAAGDGDDDTQSAADGAAGSPAEIVPAGAQEG